MHQWMGDLFYRGAGPTELEAMTWERMRYWHGWHEAMAEAETSVAKAARRKRLA